MIYIIRMVGTDAVKIGFTEGDVSERLAALQVGSPAQLVIEATATGGRARCEALHRHADGKRVRANGDWFLLKQVEVEALLENPDIEVQRWHKGGWSSYREAAAAFSAIITAARADGLLPGQPLPDEHREALEWLLAGHPRVRDLWAVKVNYFTFRERTGRPGRFGFCLVNEFGVERPFSMGACLTGVEKLPVLVTEEEMRMDPLKGLVS